MITRATFSGSLRYTLYTLYMYRFDCILRLFTKFIVLINQTMSDLQFYFDLIHA
jgi:hypothetical protein